MSDSITIDDYGQEGDRDAFASLNLAWLEEFFFVEEEDKRILGDPEAILVGGGHIFMARDGGRPIGTGALIAIEGGDFEFAKMAVDKAYQGQGIGRKLLEAALARARAAGAVTCLICTSSKLAAANALYRNVGFVDSSDPRHHRYERSDVYLEKGLEKGLGIGH